MPVTLAEAKKNVVDDLQIGVIDEFRKSSWLLDQMPFDDVVSPVGGGATLAYGYTRQITQPTAAFRAINSEYTPQEVTKQRFTAELKVFGGAFELDRIIAGMGGIASEVELQMSQKIKAARALFNDTVINGDSALDALAFDGLDKAVTGSSTDFKTATAIDLSSSAAIDSNYKIFLDEMDNFLALLDGRPSALLMNSKMKAKIRAIARRSTMYSQTMDEFGRNIDLYDGIPLIDLGDKAGSSLPVIGVDGATKKSALYAVRLGMDGFHGISMAGQPPVKTWLPDFSVAGAVKKGEVEMVAAIALKATKAAGKFSNIIVG